MDSSFDKDSIHASLQALTVELAGVEGPRQIDLMVYGGSALLLASNFREATHDIDAFIRVDDPTPPGQNRELRYYAHFLENIAGLAKSNSGRGGDKWVDPFVYMTFIDSAVDLSSTSDHIHLGTYRHDDAQMNVYVPDTSLMLAIKADTMRINENNPTGKPKDLDDILNLLAFHPEIDNDAKLIDHTAKYFPDSRKKPHVVSGAKEIFSRFRERPRHPDPHYAGQRRPEPQSGPAPVGPGHP